MSPENPKDGNEAEVALEHLYHSLLTVLPSLAGSLGIQVEPAALEKVIERLLAEEMLISDVIMPALVDPKHPRREMVFQVTGPDGTATVRAPKLHPQTAEEALANACIVAMLTSPLVRGLLHLQGYACQFAEPQPAKPKIEIVRG